MVQRRYFGRTGKPRLDLDFTDHGNPKIHAIVPHKHGWRELENGKVDRGKATDARLSLGDIIANEDILKGGK